MKRTCGAGGFHCLMSMSDALSFLRIALAVLSLCLGVKQIAVRAVLFLLTLPLDFFSHRLMHVYGLLTVRSVILDALADFAVLGAALIWIARRIQWMRTPAGMMLLLSLSGMIGRICKVKRTAV